MVRKLRLKELNYAYDEKQNTMYGYKFYSTMTGITIMFCSFNQNHLKSCIKEIYNLLMNNENGEPDDYIDYCDFNKIYIVDDENGDLIQEFTNHYNNNDGWVAIINGTEYVIKVIAYDKGRF